MSTFIIAEAGSNHDGNYEQAIDLINIAKESGADAVKFQTAKSENLYAIDTPSIAGYDDVRKLIKNIELPREWQYDLKKYCDSIGIEFMSTPFDEEAVEQLVDIGVRRFKISGFECTDPRFVKYVASTKLPLIISLGIGTHSSTMHTIVDYVRDVNPNPDITFLHCNNAYPTPHKDINLGQMTEMMINGFNIGLSDHTEGILTPPVAVALGAKVIEKHYTIDRKLSGPDHPFAIEPNELNDMIKNIRLVETMMGKKDTQYTDSEMKFSTAGRSVVSKIDLKKGDVLTKDNITTMRPLLKDSIPALEYENVIGKTMTKDLLAFHTLNKDFVK